MYDMNDNGAMKLLRGIAKKTGSPVAKKMVKRRDYAEECDVAHQLFDEMLDAFKSGQMSWKEAADDLHENMLAMKMKGEVNGED